MAILLPIRETSTGMPGWLIKNNGVEIGSMFDLGRDGPGMRWRGFAPDGTKFSARSRDKLIQLLRVHAAARSQAPSNG